jgi:hypothetical protein
MSIQDARKLIYDMRVNSELRNSAYLCSNGAEFKTYLELRGYNFKDNEFEDAANSMNLRSGNSEESAELMEIRQWYIFMRGQ